MVHSMEILKYRNSSHKAILTGNKYYKSSMINAGNVGKLRQASSHCQAKSIVLPPETSALNHLDPKLSFLPCPEALRPHALG